MTDKMLVALEKAKQLVAWRLEMLRDSANRETTGLQKDIAAGVMPTVAQVASLRETQARADGYAEAADEILKTIEAMTK